MKQRGIALAVGWVFLVTACSGLRDGDVRLIVPFEAGDNTDIVARALAPCLGEQLGTDVVVENRPGEKGVLATREFVEAGPDGHALLIAPTGPTVVAPAVRSDVDYRIEDFHFVGVAHTAPMILFTAGNGPFDTAETLLEAGRTGSVPVEVANTGALLTEELMVEVLNTSEETRLESRQVESDAELLRGVVAGDYPAGLTAISADHLAKVESGEIRVLAIGGELPPRYLRNALPFRRVTRATELPGFSIDTTLIAPANPTDKWHLTLSGALDKCLNTNDVRRDIGADFVPAELVTHGELWMRYMRLDMSVRNLDE